METRWGKLLGRYEVVAEVGRGAMGVVYKARDPKIDRFVAIKTVTLNGTNHPAHREFRDRFFVEAQAAGRLLHPGIVTVFDVGEEPETSDPYIVMEYIEGQTLQELLSREPRKLPLDGALQITEELAEALDYAHAQGVVHRDIKPANILITKEGQAKISDFGIAQLDLSHMTLPGHVLGTPAYMSPEQLEGEQVDGRSDLFSLGAILYSMLTGFSPFQGNSATTVCFRVANREPLQATALAPELPQELDSVIGRALAKNPAERYQRGMEFALDLRELRERRQLASHPRKGTLWFSEAQGRRTWLDTAKAEGSTTGTAARNSMETPARTNSSMSRLLLSRVSSSRMLVAPIVAFFLAAIVLSLFAWRQKRQPIAVAASTGTTTAPIVEQANPPAPKANPSAEVSPPAAQKSRAHAGGADSNVQLTIENHFPDATLSLWIDNQLAYAHPLHDGHKKHLGLLGGGVRETVTIPMSAGKHGLRVRVRSAAEKYEQSKSISGDFLKGGEKVLSVNFEKRSKEMHLALQ